MPNPVPAAVTGLPVATLKTPLARLAFTAEALGVPMPSDVPTGLLAADGGPAKSVQTFCIMHGASLDFIYTGDVMPLVRYTAKAMKHRGAVLDAMDELTRARDLVQLVAMTVRNSDDEDGHVASTGSNVALDMLDKAIDQLRAHIKGEAA